MKSAAFVLLNVLACVIGDDTNVTCSLSGVGNGTQNQFINVTLSKQNQIGLVNITRELRENDGLMIEYKIEYGNDVDSGSTSLCCTDSDDDSDDSFHDDDDFVVALFLRSLSIDQLKCPIAKQVKSAPPATFSGVLDVDKPARLVSVAVRLKRNKTELLSVQMLCRPSK